MSQTKLSSPWVSFVREIKALFYPDPGVNVVYEEQENKLKLYVEDGEKAVALTQLLPDHKTFGNVTLYIRVIPANFEGVDFPDLFRKAFKDNPVVDSIDTVDVLSSNTFTYVSFKKEVVQYFNDDLSDPHGLCSTLYQDIAKDVFEDADGIYFCTSDK